MEVRIDGFVKQSRLEGPCPVPTVPWRCQEHLKDLQDVSLEDLGPSHGRDSTGHGL